MSDFSGLTVQGAQAYAKTLSNKSEELREETTNASNELKSLLESNAFKTLIASTEFMTKIETLSANCGKFSDGVDVFAKFLIDKVIDDFGILDEQTLSLQQELDERLNELSSVSELGGGTIDSSQLDFSKISATAGSAALGSFIAEDKVHKKYWEGELQLVPREDGTIQIVKDGTVMGYTTEEGVDLPDNTSTATASTPDYTDSARFNAAMSTNSNGANSQLQSILNEKRISEADYNSMGPEAQASYNQHMEKIENVQSAYDRLTSSGSSLSESSGISDTAGGQATTSTEASQGGVEIPTNLGDYVAAQNGTTASQEKVNIPTNLGDYAATQNGTSTNPEIDIPTSFKEFATEYNTTGTTQSTTSGVTNTSTVSNDFAFDTSTATTSESPSSGTMDTSTASNSFASDTNSATTSQSTSSGSANTSATSNSFASDTNTTTTSQSSSSEPIDIQTNFNEFMNGQATSSSQTTSQSTGTELPNIQDFINK